jgi:hypothetical protein
VLNKVGIIQEKQEGQGGRKKKQAEAVKIGPEEVEAKRRKNFFFTYCHFK